MTIQMSPKENQSQINNTRNPIQTLQKFKFHRTTYPNLREKGGWWTTKKQQKLGDTHQSKQKSKETLHTSYPLNPLKTAFFCRSVHKIWVQSSNPEKNQNPVIKKVEQPDEKWTKTDWWYREKWIERESIRGKELQSERNRLQWGDCGHSLHGSLEAFLKDSWIRG